MITPDPSNLSLLRLGVNCAYAEATSLENEFRDQTHDQKDIGAICQVPRA